MATVIGDAIGIPNCILLSYTVFEYLLKKAVDKL